jgi:DUF1707 SHOCT-like domain
VLAGEVPGVAGPGDDLAAGAASRSRLRAAHADREQAIEVLKAAFVQGQLDRDEFDLRIGRALTSRTYADLAALTADIAADRLAGGRPLPPASEPANRKKKAAAALACATFALLAGVVALPPLPDGSPAEMSVIVAIFVLSGIVASGWFLLLHAWLEERAGTQSTQGLPPGEGGAASQRLAQANPARKLPQVNRNPRRAAKASPIHRLRPALPS